MHPKQELERRCRESYMKLIREERMSGLNSQEAAIYRAEWASYDSAYRLIYNERLEYIPIPHKSY